MYFVVREDMFLFFCVMGMGWLVCGVWVRSVGWKRRRYRGRRGMGKILHFLLVIVRFFITGVFITFQGRWLSFWNTLDILD